MPLIPIYAAERRVLGPDGYVRLVDFVFAYRRIARSRRLTDWDATSEIRVDRADVPTINLAAPPGSRLALSRDPLTGLMAEVLAIPEGDGAASVELTARDAVEAALHLTHGLHLFRVEPAMAGGGGGA